MMSLPNHNSFFFLRFFFLNLFILFIYFWLHWVFVAVHGLLIAVACLIAEHGLQVHRLQQLWHTGSVVVACGLWSAGSAVVVHWLSGSTVCGIFLHQGSNLCPLHQAGGFLTTAPPGQPKPQLLKQLLFYTISILEILTHHYI